MRLFIAIEISEEIKAGLMKVVDKLKEAGADVKWVRMEGMHITLKFLGEVDEKKGDEIVNILERVSEGKSPFTVAFEGLGAFPDLKSPRVVWTGIEKGKETLKDIAKELDASLSALGFPEEKREFSPHLTLGRVKSGRNMEELTENLKSYIGFVLPELSVTSINLMQSILKREGAEYKMVKEAYFKVVSDKL